MKCDDLKNCLADYLSGGEPALNDEARSHLAGCSQCSSEYESLSRLWDKLGMLDDELPGKAMRARFFSMLDGYRDGLEISLQKQKHRHSLNPLIGAFLPGRAAFQFAIAALILVAGILIGRLFTFERQGTSDMAQVREEVHSLRQMVALSLLQQQSASERLAGVSWSQRVRQPDEKVLGALVHALNFDPSVDVRLAAVDALSRFSSYSQIRQELIGSLPRQSSPLVQIALIDLMVEMGERQSAQVLRQLADDKNVNQTVRERAKWGLQRLS